MTREEASNILDDFDVNFEGHTAEEVAEAFDVAFRALEQEPCEDCISRQAVLEITAETGALETQSRVRDMQAVISIQDNATNGDVIRALFPYISVEDNCQLYYSIDIENLSKDKKLNTVGFKKEWWNAPYKADRENKV